MEKRRAASKRNSLRSTKVELRKTHTSVDNPGIGQLRKVALLSAPLGIKTIIYRNRMRFEPRDVIEGSTWMTFQSPRMQDNCLRRTTNRGEGKSCGTGDVE